MEVARKRAIAGRIKDARERSKWKQPQVAERLGLTLRGYQKVEQKGTADYERCEELAGIFEVPGVTADHLWGEAEQPASNGRTSPMDDLSAPASSADLDRVEQNLLGKIEQLVERVGKLQAQQTKLLAELARERRSRQGQQRKQKRSG